MLRRVLRVTAGLTAGAMATACTVYRKERVAVPAGNFQLICAATASRSPPIVLKRLSTDNYMGAFDAYYLAATWFYGKPLDAATIKATIASAVEVMPALAGRRTKKGIVLSNEGVRLTVREQHPGSALDWVGPEIHEENAAVRDFADSPSSCAGGKQPLFTVRITNFRDGTSALGIASPHSLMDGKGYMQVVSALSAAHTSMGRFDNVTVPDFDAAAVWEDRTKGLDIDREPALWFAPFRLLELTEPLWALAMPRLDLMLPRAKVHLSLAELTELKAAVSEVMAKGSGSQSKATSKAQLTVNEALSAAFFLALAKEPNGPFTAGQPGTVRMVVNAQGKGLFADVENVVGNFSWMQEMHTSKPPSAMTDMEAALFFFDFGAKWRDSATATRCVEEFAIFFRVQDHKGCFWSQTDNIDNILFINNQSSMPTAKICFGAGPPIGYQPWHSQHHLQIVAAADAPEANWTQRHAAGVDVYLPKMYSPLLGTPEFKQKLLHEWRSS